ncbi:transglycosylase domain-containing protein [Hyphomicrobium sulfonivorans]|uniref:Multimodular transpeptidase-transglycosylase n=1 Tax=Hyphomicrobium sulfonivorans TaxID=121290 RepID=A0A109BDW3_HYPSL|nr:PBP1A family penicillin-binding protein [Hyphomicrobium sulfonivorans]KWT67009.1 Multimodular transpeptidase-transglycosylase [Hyphomicrobium sulfonivorans]MBI1650839.1 PBP1A family penicillin-binding protein [Hyphomicrobium sulfonivorans]NSL71203.1 penicillin-binding protein [Hyphomicrobium sulfonivorans]
MQDWFFKRGRRERTIDWLALDSRLDSGLAAAWSWFRDTWNAGSSFFDRFRLRGWKRLLNEAASEGLTLGAGGFVVMFALAIPAFHEFNEGKFLTGQYAVKFLDQNGNEIGKRGILHNDAVPLDEIPDPLIKATLATEDRRFFEHWGIDVLGTLRALVTNLQANDVVQGGSSITQQVAKNLFLSSERSMQRKIKEAFLALLLESRFTKREILKFYFDRAYMGGGAFGAEAASQFYFAKSVRQINMAEAAMLAGLFKAPTKYAPHVNLPASRARTSIVLDNLVEAGFYTAGQVHWARTHPANIVENRNTSSPDWFLDWAFEEVQRIAAGTGQYVLTARTTVDLNIQKATDDALTAALRKYRGNRVTSGAIALLETDGAVRAITGGPDYGESQFNRATSARRQPGSSFKVYVYAAALENGYTPTTSVRDASRRCGNWHPQNYGGSHGSGGRMPLWMALAKSLNTVAAELSFAVGRDKVIELTERLGVTGIRKTCSMALGDYGISPLQHAGGFATFANGGKQAKPYAILDIVSSRGDLVYSRDRDEPEAPQIVDRKVAEGMNWMMHKVVETGTAQRAKLDFTHVVGKTGTSSGPKDVWFVGFTGKYVASVWLGKDDNRAMVNGTTGGQYAAPVFQSFMSVIHRDMNIPTIPGLQPHPVQVAEQQRIAAMHPAGVAPQEQRKGSSLMSDKTRDALRNVAQALRKAGGIEEPAASPQPENSTGSTRSGAAPATPASPSAPPGRRADAAINANPAANHGTSLRAVP